MKKIIFIILFFCSTFVYASKHELVCIIGNNEIDTNKYVMPEFPGGSEAMGNFVNENMVYPNQNLEDEGRVLLTFIIDTSGEISNIRVLKSLEPAFDTAAINLVKKMPKWIPGEMNGKKVKVSFNMPFSFQAQTAYKSSKNKFRNSHYPGSNHELSRLINKNLKYPKAAKEAKIEGIIAVHFEIAADGTISNPKLVNSLGYGIDEEALRLYELLPKQWKPAKDENGNSVESGYTLEMEFKL